MDPRPPDHTGPPLWKPARTPGYFLSTRARPAPDSSDRAARTKLPTGRHPPFRRPRAPRHRLIPARRRRRRKPTLLRFPSPTPSRSAALSRSSSAAPPLVAVAVKPPHLEHRSSCATGATSSSSTSPGGTLMKLPSCRRIRQGLRTVEHRLRPPPGPTTASASSTTTLCTSPT